jgi:hypothetical protein
MGHSAIAAIIRGETGPTGSKGLRGLTGNVGIGEGLTGITGPSGVYITSSLATVSNTILFKSDNTVFLIDQTQGPIGYTGTMYGENRGTGLTLYSAINGFTLSVRGLTFIGNLSATVTGGTILITPTDVYYGVTFASGIQNNRLVYSKSSSTIDSTRIQLGNTNNDFIFSNVNGITTGSFPVYSEISGNVIEIPSGSNNLLLGLTAGSIYHIHTPIGITGFTLNPSLYGDNEILSFTFLVEGSGFTQFPSNVYFEDSPYSSIFGCGTNIMNVLTYDKGQNWFATITDRGYGTDGCVQQESIGSCCYVGISGDRECQEYVTENWCDQQTSGIFNALVACDPLCGKTAICCSNGKCVEGVTEEECGYFLGKYYKNITCSLGPNEGDNLTRLCYDPTQSPVCCCTGGTCIDSVTALICQQYYRGTPVSGKCCETNCTTFGRIQGACCIQSNDPQCLIKTPAECGASGGLFYGDGTVCADVDCCFETKVPIGHCCIDGNCLSDFTQQDCVSSGGSWYGDLSSCNTNCVSTFGYCCLFGSCEFGYTETNCTDIAGSWFANQSSCSQNCGSCCQPVPGSSTFCNYTSSRFQCEITFVGTWYPNNNCSGECT